MPKALNVGSLYFRFTGTISISGITVKVDEIHIMKNINCLWDVMILRMRDKGK